MTELTWKNWTPQYDGHAPDDWDGGYRQYFTLTEGWTPVCTNKDKWFRLKYRYFAKPLQDAAHEPDLLAQCLALPQADRDALIEALQKPQRDWADDVWMNAFGAYEQNGYYNLDRSAAVIRSMCRPKEEN